MIRLCQFVVFALVVFIQSAIYGQTITGNTEFFSNVSEAEGYNLTTPCSLLGSGNVAFNSVNIFNRLISCASSEAFTVMQMTSNISHTSLNGLIVYVDTTQDSTDRLCFRADIRASGYVNNDRSTSPAVYLTATGEKAGVYANRLNPIQIQFGSTYTLRRADSAGNEVACGTNDCWLAPLFIRIVRVSCSSTCGNSWAAPCCSSSCGSDYTGDAIVIGHSLIYGN